MQQRQKLSIDELWDKTWKDKDGAIVIWSWPNAWLIGWVVLVLASLIVPRGNAQSVLWWLSEIVLAIWSLFEIFKGANYFRRAIGVLVLLLVIAAAFGLGR